MNQDRQPHDELHAQANELGICPIEWAKMKHRASRETVTKPSIWRRIVDALIDTRDE